ncbi:MAG: hypothetical protein M0Q40_12330 [Limnochordia bacterium]|nr:hypothetical protein [Limnochordia bacterium]
MGNSDVIRAGIMGLVLLVIVGFLALPLPSTIQIRIFNHIHFALLYVLAVVGVILLLEQIINLFTKKKPARRAWVMLLSAIILALGLAHILTAKMSVIHIVGSYDKLLNESPWTILKTHISEAAFLDKLMLISVSGVAHTALGLVVLLLEILRGMQAKKSEMTFAESILFSTFILGVTSLLVFVRNLSVRSAWRRNFDLVAPAIIQPGEIPTGVTKGVLNVIQWTIKAPFIILGISLVISVITYVFYRLRQTKTA